MYSMNARIDTAIENARTKALQKLQPAAVSEEVINNQRGGVLNQKIYFVNKSRSKFVSVGLYPNLSFLPVVKISSSNGGQSIILNEREWQELLENQGILINYFLSDLQSGNQTLPLLSKNIAFQTFNGIKLIKIEGEGCGVYLARKSMFELWDIVPLIQHKLDMLKRQQFVEFYYSVLRGILNIPGNMEDNVRNVISPLMVTNSENAYTMLEMLHFFIDRVEADVERQRFCDEFRGGSDLIPKV